MNSPDPVDTFKLPKGLVLNVYVYQSQLVGIVEDPEYLQIYEMQSEYHFTPGDYIAWRFASYWPTSVIGENGKPVKDFHLHDLLFKTSEETGWPVFIVKNKSIFY